jgi:hypothetical protein
MPPLEYLITAPIPSIEAEPDDILAWDHPHAALVRSSAGALSARLINLGPDFALFFHAHAGCLTPYAASPAPAASHRRVAVGAATPLPAEAAPSPAPLRLVP